MSTADPVAALLSEADQLLAEAARRDLALRLAGSAGILRHCDACRAASAALARERPADLDFFAYRKQHTALGRMFTDLGYQADPAVAFSQEYGIDRLIYLGCRAATKIDVFLDALRMSHTIEFGGRLGTDGPSAAAADLLLAKLQIHQVTEKDLKDIATLLAAHPVGEEPGAIEAGHVLARLSRDWGLSHTATGNLSLAARLLPEWPAAGPVARQAAGRIDDLQRRIEAAPKSVRWRARASVGTRVRWYEEVGDADQQGQGDAGIAEG
ncbi:MAG TPA: hypothetical protein VGG35_17375 [Streptosporangiaceae bacterium]